MYPSLNTELGFEVVRKLIAKHYGLKPTQITDDDVVAEVENLNRRRKAMILDDRGEDLYATLRLKEPSNV